MLEAIREYNWKWLLELFYGLGVAIVLAAALFVLQNNPFEQPADNFDSFDEWRTWFLLGLSVTFRALWVGLSALTAKVLQAVVDGLSETSGPFPS